MVIKQRGLEHCSSVVILSFSTVSKQIPILDEMNMAALLAEGLVGVDKNRFLMFSSIIALLCGAN